MAIFLLEATYTPTAWAALVAKPESEEARLAALATKAGGKLVALFHGIGKQSVIAIVDLPSTAAAAALTAAVQKAGHLTDIRMTMLLTGQEFVAALQQAASLTYRGPGSP